MKIEERRTVWKRWRTTVKASSWLFLVPAICCLGASAQTMEGVRSTAANGDPSKAVEMAYRLAADGDADAELYLGRCYLLGEGVEADAFEAIRLLFRAREGGSSQAGDYLSVLRRKVFDPETPVEVRQVVRSAFSRYVREEISELYSGFEYQAAESTVGTQLFQAGRKKEALAALMAEARALEPAAILLLKILYRNPVEGVPRHDPAILELFEELALDGEPEAKWVVGLIYFKGIGVDQDRARAVEWLEQVSREEARRMLADHYLSEGRQEDATRAIRESAKAGDVWGLYRYGIILGDSGLSAEAVRLFEAVIAKEPEHWEAVKKVAQACLDGEGVPPDRERAFLLYKRCADRTEDPLALYVTGRLLWLGIGTPVSPEAARIYLKRAADKGVEPAVEALAELNTPAANGGQSPSARLSGGMKALPEPGAVPSRPAPSPRPKAPSPSSPTPSPETAPARPDVHVVRKGDTFYGIANRYGIPYNELKRANSRVNEFKLRVGQKLKIPPKP